MKFHVLTLFPDMITQGMSTSIIGRATDKQLIEINAVNIRDYTTDKHGKADDYTYGGGAGMLMQAQPVYDAWHAVTQGRKVRTVYVTPQGRPFSQVLAKELAGERELVFLCGHYEGIDERVLEETVTDYVSIGDYVLTGGELPAMVMIDAIARLVPGVLNNESSAQTESFHNDLLEYPQYSRPEEWHGKKVPEVLLSGNHAKITEWRLEESIKRTKERRPDLYRKYAEKERVIKLLSKHKRNNIHIMENLTRGKAEILYVKGNSVLIYNRECRTCMATAENPETAEKMLDAIPDETYSFVSSQSFLNELLCSRKGFVQGNECYQGCYTSREPLPVKHKDIRLLNDSHLDYVEAHYANGSREYLQGRIEAKELFGAFVEEQLVGFAGVHDDGSCGLLYVEEAYRGRGIAKSLEAYVINLQRALGYTPYGHIIVGNDASVSLQEKMGIYIAPQTIWWLERNN